MLKAVIFYFDGVLGNTYELNFQIIKNYINPEVTEQDFAYLHL